MADYIIDTSQLLTRELHAALGNIFLGKQEYDNIYVTVLSFGSNMAFRQMQIWYLMFVFCQFIIIWKRCGRKPEMIRRFSSLC